MSAPPPTPDPVPAQQRKQGTRIGLDYVWALCSAIVCVCYAPVFVALRRMLEAHSLSHKLAVFWAVPMALGYACMGMLAWWLLFGLELVGRIVWILVLALAIVAFPVGIFAISLINPYNTGRY